MKKIIKGKLYDTDTAKHLGLWFNGRLSNDLSYCAESLYQKRTGEYFLFGDGGPMSKYSKMTGDNSWSGSSEIIPLSYDSARQWASEYLSADEFQTLFGDIVDDDSKKFLTCSVSVTAYNKVKHDAARLGISVSALVDQLIMSYDG